MFFFFASLPSTLYYSITKFLLAYLLLIFIVPLMSLVLLIISVFCVLQSLVYFYSIFIFILFSYGVSAISFSLDLLSFVMYFIFCYPLTSIFIFVLPYLFFSSFFFYFSTTLFYVSFFFSSKFYDIIKKNNIYYWK